MKLLLKTTRGLIDDLYTFGSIVVVDSKGKIVKEWGDAEEVAFPRSSAKLFQALLALKLGAVEKFNLNEKEISQMCASHSGEDFHVTTVKSMLEKSNLDESHLKCGSHYPLDKDIEDKMRISGEKPRDIHNNCSGKHAGMLIASKIMGASLDNYFMENHPVQKEIVKILSDICEFDIKDDYISIDGCGLPVHAMPLYNYALGMAKFSDYNYLDDEYRNHARTIIESIIKYPKYMSGTKRIDNIIISKYPGKVIVKSGSNGFIGGLLLDDNLGFCIKTYDGIEINRDIILVELLKKLGLIKNEDYEYFDNILDRYVKNHRKEIVGKKEILF